MSMFVVAARPGVSATGSTHRSVDAEVHTSQVGPTRMFEARRPESGGVTSGTAYSTDGADGVPHLDAVAGSEFVDDRIRLRDDDTVEY